MKRNKTWIRSFSDNRNPSYKSVRLDSDERKEPMLKTDVNKMNPVVGFGHFRMKPVRSLSDKDLDFVIKANHVTSFVKEVAVNEREQRTKNIS